MIISIAFTLAGIAALTGVLRAGNVVGWLAMGAAAASAANVVTTRWAMAAYSKKPPEAHP